MVSDEKRRLARVGEVEPSGHSAESEPEAVDDLELVEETNGAERSERRRLGESDGRADDDDQARGNQDGG